MKALGSRSSVWKPFPFGVRGDFALELWQFYEAFQERHGQATGSTRRNVRVTLAGQYHRWEVPSVHLAGFAEPGLNQVGASASDKGLSKGLL